MTPILTRSYGSHFSTGSMQDAEKEYSLFPSRKHTQRLLRYMWPAGRPDIKVRVATALSLMIGTKFLTVTVPIVFSSIVDTLSPDLAIVAAASNPFALSVVGLAVSYGLVRFTLTLVQELRYAIFTNVAQKAINEIGVLIFRTLLRQDVSFHVSRRTGGLARQVDRGTRGVNTLIHILLFQLSPTLLELCLVCSVLQGTLGWEFAGTAFVAVAFYSAFTYFVTEWRAKFRVEMNALDTKTNQILVDSLMNYEAVCLYNNEEHEVKRYHELLEGYYVHSARVTWSFAFLNFGQGVIMTAAIATITVMSIHGIQAGTLTVGGLVLVNSLMLQLWVPLNFLGSMYRELSSASIDMQSLFTLMESKPTHSEETCTKYVFKGGAIEFRDVSFTYPALPGTTKTAGMLQNVSFKIPPGQSVGLVGPTAAGKSTALRLLTKFYLPTKGQVLIDGQDISTLTASSLREHVGVVSQENLLFNDTIRYNIQYGRLNAREEDVIEAAKNAAIHEGIMAREQKYETVVGERGARLSGGERQRIALARVLLRNPSILLADEATSALDSKTEALVMRSLKPKGRTVLLVAHRLTTVRDCDLIIVFKEGRVIEQGTHDELLKIPDGLYNEMWQKQLKEPKEEDERKGVSSSSKP